MFQSDGNIKGSDTLIERFNELSNNYILSKNDLFSFQLFTNKGEILVDPSGVLKATPIEVMDKQTYLVYADLTADLPLVGKVKVGGMNVRQLDSILAIKYEPYFQGVYVKSRIMNHRVFLMGAFGSRVVPLINEDMSIIEVLALAGQAGQLGGNVNAKYYNIRLIRGNLKNPTVYVMDLTSIEGLRMAQTHIQPNDIVYVEPHRKILVETIQEFFPIISVISTLLTIYVIFAR